MTVTMTATMADDHVTVIVDCTCYQRREVSDMRGWMYMRGVRDIYIYICVSPPRAALAPVDTGKGGERGERRTRGRGEGGANVSYRLHIQSSSFHAHSSRVYSLYLVPNHLDRSRFLIARLPLPRARGFSLSRSRSRDGTGRFVR